MERTKGKIEAAEQGTLFLDEVGEMPLAMQAKLLRFIENRRFMRVGGASKIQADVRLVFATLRALEQEVAAELREGGQLTVDLAEPLDRIVGRIIEAALALEQGNRARAAERLGISIRTIQRHIARGTGA